MENMEIYETKRSVLEKCKCIAIYVFVIYLSKNILDTYIYTHLYMHRNIRKNKSAQAAVTKYHDLGDRNNTYFS